jgi:tRNA modification GTPase
MPRLHDTIAALATPVGTSAIALLRISGPETARLLADIAGRTPPPRVATHLDYTDRHGAFLDDVLVTFFAGPRSYTGEDAAEIGCHGNPFIAQKILEDLFARGCRPAEPGEFTQRAFLGGRMDLSQAEAVMDLIHARSERALQAAHHQLRGALGRQLQALIESLLAVLAHVEAYIDFPDEDLPPENRARVMAATQGIRDECARLKSTDRYGHILREGIRTVILGFPNVGKSSLLNRLVGRDRALVSAEPGTTRDFIEEVLTVGPHCLRLVDTAGLNPSPSPLERLGMEKTRERAAEADLILVVLDASQPPIPPASLPPELADALQSERTLVVLNKCDIPAAAAPTGAREGMPPAATPVPPSPAIRVSALTGEGIDALRRAIVARADSFQPQFGEEVIAVNARHALALETAQTALGEALEKLRTAAPVELLAADLRAALAALGEITGKVDNERMLDHLFAAFCIGK